MASGFKEGPPPGHLYVIKNHYEIRYYTTPESYAQALVEGYQGELAVYRRCETPPDAEIQKVLEAHPRARPLANLYALHPNLRSRDQQQSIKEYEKEDKVRRKTIKQALLKILERY